MNLCKWTFPLEALHEPRENFWEFTRHKLQKSQATSLLRAMKGYSSEVFKAFKLTVYTEKNSPWEMCSKEVSGLGQWQDNIWQREW